MPATGIKVRPSVGYDYADMTQATAEKGLSTVAPPRNMPLWLAGLLFLALSVVATWPLAYDLGGAMFRAGADTDLVIWIYGWDAHAFLHQPFSIFDANIYYPERHTLAFAENLIGSALIAAPVIWATGNLVAAVNVVSIVSCALCGLGAFFLARRVGLSTLAAFVSGLVFAFAPPRFGRLAQPHLNAVQWLPFALGALHGYLDTGRRRDLWLATAFFSLQALSSGHGAVYAVLSLLALLVYRVALGDPIAPLRRLRDFGVVGCLALLPAIFVILPYRSIQHDSGLQRTLTPNWAPPLVNFLSSYTHVHKYLASLVPSLHIAERANGALFFGIVPLLLTLAALWPRFRKVGASGWLARRAAKRREGRSIDAGPGDGLAQPGAKASLAWRAMALALDVLAMAAVAIAVYRIIHGPFKIRWERQVVFSAVAGWRPWVVAAAFLVARAGVWRRVPFDPLRWARPAWRGLAAAGRAAGSGVWAVTRRTPAAVQRWRSAHRQSALLFYTLLGVGSLLLILPEPFGIWPYVHSLPGFNMVRVVGRFTIITLVAVAVLAGFGFDRLASALRPRARAALFAVVFGLLAFEYNAVPLNPSPYTIDIPPIDRWLDTQPKPFAVAEVPLKPLEIASDIGPFEQRQAVYMLHSMAHWQKTVHAFSGFRTWFHEDLFAAMQGFPNQASLDTLEKIKVNYIVVHTDYYPPGQWEVVEGKIAAFPDRLRLLHTEGPGRVYELTAERRRAEE